MTLRRKTDFDSAYARAVMTIMSSDVEVDERTGLKYRAVPGMVFKESGFPLMTLRDIRPLWAFAEAVWFMSGSGDPSFMRSFGFKAWDKFADRGGTCRSALGYRWAPRDGGECDQLDWLVTKLSADPTAKSCCLDAWIPEVDLPSKRDKPCVPFWHFTMVRGDLHLSVMQRSADMWFGFPHDIAGASIIQRLVAEELEVGVGKISWLIGNAHLYEDQFGPATEVIRELDRRTSGSSANFGLVVPDGSYERAREGSDLLVWDLWRQVQPTYDNMKGPDIRGPRLVV